MIIIKEASLSKEVILRVLLDSNQDFTPPLSLSLDLNLYAEKLSNHAVFIVLKDNDNILGCLAFYTNAIENFVYVPYFWISHEKQKDGWGRKLLTYLVNITNSRYKEIRLEEVKNNFNAFSFYKKNNFNVIEDRNSKYLLSRIL